jgi:hypothetical protein
MPTQLDLDNLHNAGDDDVSGLPVDAQELYHRLTREGADARDSIARIDQRLQERIAKLSATQVASQPEPEPLAAISAPQRSPRVESFTRRAPRYPATRRWATMLATAAVVVAFVGVLTVTAGHRNESPPSHRTPTVATSPTSAPTTDWVDLTQLDYNADYSSSGFPAVAPSHPQVVYQTMAYGNKVHHPATLRATSDGGATWHTLRPPMPADHITDAYILVSPLDPQTIFLTLDDHVVADCPATSTVTPGYSGFDAWCEIDYSSFDGGAHWSLTKLPEGPGSTSGGLIAGLLGNLSGVVDLPILSQPLGAQGPRLYSGATYPCRGPHGDGCNRLVTSDDGGRTWSFADLPLLPHGAGNICDYTASPFSPDLYAVTTPTNCAFTYQAKRTLWHSVDAGATWVKVGQLATPHEQGMVLARDRISGVPLLYMAQPVTTSYTKDKMGDSLPAISHAPSDVKFSMDGGATWQSAPTMGIPSGYAAFFGVGLLGPLSDGSVVMDVIPSSSDLDNFQGSDLYAWKPGDTGWRPIGSVPREIDGLLVIPSPTGDGDTVYAFLTSRGDTNTFTILKKHVAPST